MKNLVLFGIFVLFLVAMQFAGGRTVDEIIEKHIRAKGGLAKLDAVQSIYMQGIITLLGIAALIKITKVQQQTNPSGFNAEWQITGVEGNSSAAHINAAFIEEEVAGMQTEPGLSEHLINYADKGYIAVLIGKEVVDGTPCYHLRLNAKEENVLDYWINAHDFLLFRSSYKNNYRAAVQTKYTDYRMADGLQAAHFLEIQMLRKNENIRVEISFDKIIIN